MNVAYLPPLDWQDFERLTLVYAQCLFNDPGASANGRPGREQHGVDVYARHPGTGGLIGIQCKQKDMSFRHVSSKLTASEILHEVNLAGNFQPPLQHYIIATTGSRDPGLQEVVRNLSRIGWENGSFQISLWFWQDYVEAINRFAALRAFYHDQFPQLETGMEHDQAILDVVRTVMDRPAFKMSLMCEHPGDFHQALIDTGTAISMGQLIDRESRMMRAGATGGLGKLKGDVHERGRNVQSLITELREKYELACARGIIVQNGHYLVINKRGVADYLDGMRGEALRELNRLLEDYGIKPVDSPYLGADKMPLPSELLPGQQPESGTAIPSTPALHPAESWDVVLQYWRMQQARTFTGDPPPVTARALVQFVVKSLRPVLDTSVLKVKMTGTDEPIKRSVDLHMLCGCLSVMLKSALKHATPPPALTLGISARQGQCVISVETRTQAPDRKEDIFAESCRTASVRKDQGDECLSLELAAEVARQQGGGMEVEWRPVMGDAKGSSQTPSYRLEYRLLLP